MGLIRVARLEPFPASSPMGCLPVGVRAATETNALKALLDVCGCTQDIFRAVPVSTDSRDERVWVVGWWCSEAMKAIEASKNSERTLCKLPLPILPVSDARSCTSLQISERAHILAQRR